MYTHLMESKLLTIQKEHRWLSKGGEDPMPSKEDNVLEPIEPPTEEELNAAITGNMRHLMVVVCLESFLLLKLTVKFLWTQWVDLAL